MNTGTTTSDRNDFTVALFDGGDNANKAIRDLRDAGFKAHEIGAAVGDPRGTGVGREEHHRSFWQKLFGGDDYSNEKNLDNVEDIDDGTTLAIPDSYAERLRSGSYLVAVLAGGRRSDASAILTRNKGEIQTGFATPSAANVARDRGEGEYGGDRIQLLSERLRINKERVPTGEARLHKEVVTEQQTIQVPVSHEELVMERVPVSGGVAAQGKVGSGGDIRIPLSEERVTVDKQNVVTGEVRVGKKTVQETRNVTDSVRHEELKVENDTKRDRDTMRDTESADPLRRKSA